MMVIAGSTTMATLFAKRKRAKTTDPTASVPGDRKNRSRPSVLESETNKNDGGEAGVPVDGQDRDSNGWSGNGSTATLTDTANGSGKAANGTKR